MVKRGVLYLGTAIVSVLLGCASQIREERGTDELTALEREYDALKASKNGEDLVQAALEFARKNPEHFRSNGDLGVHYIANGDAKMGKEYLLKAKELVKNAPKTSIGEEYIATVYGILGEIAISEGDLAGATEYAELVETFDNNAERRYQILKPRILVSQGEREEALVLFDKIYREQPEIMTSDDIKAHMALLGLAGRFEECADLVDLYFEKGSYYDGLGWYASVVYGQAGQLKKSLYATFLEFEFNASYRFEDPVIFLNSIDSFEQKMEQWKLLDETREAIRLVRSAYDPSAEYRQPENPSFFVEEYIIIKNRIRDNTVNIHDYDRFLRLQHYFTEFPVYYWNIWLAVGMLRGREASENSLILEKIIALGNNNIYIQPARDELAKILGQ
jgi:tetratricopeptide (TPR) repeat protein